MSQQGPKSPHEDFIMFFVVLFLVFGLSALIWHMYHQQLTNAVRWIRVGEMWLVSLWTDPNYSVTYEGQRHVLKDWRSWLQKAPVRSITPHHIEVMTVLALDKLKNIFSLILVAGGLGVVFFGSSSKYKKQMNLEGLMKEQAKMFPSITPFLTYNPGKIRSRAPGDPVPKRLPLFAEALSPEEWVAYHQIPYKGGKLDRNKAWQALGQQLGRRWQGPLKLPLHAQGLYAAFALKHVRKRKDSEELLAELSRSWTAEKGFNPSLKLRNHIRSVIKDPKIGGKLASHVDRHAYETTALLRALNRARQEGGVLASAEFIWLRGHDRALWYPLNNLGRRAYHAEASGALTHYVNEIIADQRIPTPRFDEVIKVIEAWLASPSARPIPPLEGAA